MYCSEILISVSWKDHLYFYIQHKKMPNLTKPKMFITKKKMSEASVSSTILIF